MWSNEEVAAQDFILCRACGGRGALVELDGPNEVSWGPCDCRDGYEACEGCGEAAAVLLKDVPWCSKCRMKVAQELAAFSEVA